MSWTEFKPFTDWVGIKPFTGHPGRRGVWVTSLEQNESDHFSQAEGCFPISGELLDYNTLSDISCGLYFIRVKGANGISKSGYFDYIGMATGKNAPEFQQGIFGRVYQHYRKLICLPDRQKFNHLIQKYHLGSNGKKEQAVELLKAQEFNDYAELREFFHAPHIAINPSSVNEYGTTTKFQQCFEICSMKNDINSISGIQKFFKSQVELSIFVVKGKAKNDSAKYIEKVAKGEGIALAVYKKEFGEMPYLNKRDDLIGFDSLPSSPRGYK